MSTATSPVADKVRADTQKTEPLLELRAISKTFPGLVTVRSLRSMPVPKEVMVTPAIIDASNLKQYDVPIESRTCPKLDEVAVN